MHRTLTTTLAALALLAGCTATEPPAGTAEPPPLYPKDGDRTTATVERVIDGDTLTVRVDDQTVNVRVLGIDAPERRPRECGYQSATGHLAEFAPTDSDVTLVADTGEDDRDRYGRLLRYVRANHTDASRSLVAAGWAKVYDRYPTSATPELRDAQQHAQKGRLGIWADGCPP